MRLDVAGREPAAVQREDLVVEPLEAALALSDDLRFEAPVAIPRSVDRHLSLLGNQRLRRRPVTRVAPATGRLVMGLVAEMVGQLDLHRPLHQPLSQLGQQAAGPGDLLLGPRAGEQLVDHLIGDPLAVRALHHATQSRAFDGVLDQTLAQGPGR